MKFKVNISLNNYTTGIKYDSDGSFATWQKTIRSCKPLFDLKACIPAIKQPKCIDTKE